VGGRGIREEFSVSKPAAKVFGSSWEEAKTAVEGWKLVFSKSGRKLKKKVG